MSQNLHNLITEADALLRLPQSALRVMELTQATDTLQQDLLDALQIDPNFVARLLRLANSQAYSRGNQVTSLDRAVSMIGFREIGHMAISLAAAKEFSKIESELLRSSSFWNHSLTTALLARRKAQDLHLNTDGVFVAGLLHDVGLPIEFAFCSSQMTEAMELSLMSEDINLLTAENQVLGFDHSDTGAALCEAWGLPSVIVETARHHHAPQLATNHPTTVAIVAWANIVESLGTDADSESVIAKAELLAGVEQDLPLSLTDNDNDRLLREAQEEAASLLMMF